MTTIGFDTDDTVSWDEAGISFIAYAENATLEGIEFQTTGTVATFDVLKDGLRQPRIIRVGQYGVKPAELPLTLGRPRRTASGHTSPER